MDAMADFASVSQDAWPHVLAAVRLAGVAIDIGECDQGIQWHACVRGHARVELGYCPQDPGRELVVYAPTLRFWRRPLSMGRLFGDVRRAVLAAGGKLA